MEVEFQLTPDDLTALKRWHAKHPPVPPQPGQKVLVNVVSWVVAFGIVFGFMVIRAFIDDPLIDYLCGQFPGFVVGAFVVILSHTFVTKLAVRNATRKTLEMGRNAEKVLGWRRISIEPRALHVDTDHSSLTYLWWAVDAITASEDHAFIYFMTTNAFILPREAFRTDRAFAVFVETARRYHYLAGVAGAARPGAGDADWRQRNRSPGVRPPAEPGGAQPDEGIVPAAPPADRSRPNA